MTLTKGLLVANVASLAAEVLSRPALLGEVRLVAVDGRAGSGKTTLAQMLAAALRDQRAAVGEIHTDDLLDGWTSIVSYWQRLADEILGPLAVGRSAVYHPYDWDAGCFGTSRVSVPVPDVLIVEGVASIGACGNGTVTLSLGVVVPRTVRFERGLLRDGVRFRDHWLRWMDQEDSYFTDKTGIVPDVVVDGDPMARYDRNREYVVANSDRWRADQ